MIIKKCPFCGNNNLSIGKSVENKTYEMYSFIHHCNDMIINSTWKRTKKELIELWNKRVTDYDLYD